MRRVRVGSVSDFEDPGKQVIVIGDDEIGVFRLGDSFHAWHNVCPHQGGPVCQGRIYPRVREELDDTMRSHGRIYDEQVKNIVCPWHGLEFDIRTGRHPGTPELALRAAEVTVEAGVVYVSVA